MLPTPPPTHTVPKFRIEVTDPAENFRLRRHQLSVCDNLKALIATMGGDVSGLPLGQGVSAAEILSSFGQQSAFSYLSEKLSLIEFGKQVGETVRSSNAGSPFGDDGIVAGFRMKPQAFQRHVSINPTQSDPAGNSAFEVIEFEQILPSLNAGLGRFESVLPDGEAALALYFPSQLPNKKAQARTKKALPKNAQWETRLTIVDGHAAGHLSTPGIRIGFAGGALSIVLREGAEAVLERRSGGKDVPIGRINGTKCRFQSGTQIICKVEMIGGRLVVSITAGGTTHIQDFLAVQVSAHGSNAGASPNAAPGAPRAAPKETPTDFDLPAGKLFYQFWGCQATASLTILACLEAVTVNGVTSMQPMTAQAERKIRRSLPAGLTGSTQKGIRGWFRQGSGYDLDVKIDEHGCTYTVTIKASPDGVSGFWTGTFIQWQSDVTAVVTAPFDITPAFIEAQGESGSITGNAGSRWEIFLDRNVLEQLPLPAGATSWWEVLRVDATFQISQRWMLADRSHTAWVGLCQGIVVEDAAESPRFGTRTLRVVVRDKIALLSEPWGVVTEKACALDVMLASNATRRRGVVYGCEMVQKIIELSPLGPSVAAQLNDGDLFSGQHASHFPLLGGDGQVFGLCHLPLPGIAPPVLSTRFQFPPPWGEDYITWIKRSIASLEFMYLSFRHAMLPDGTITSQWPQPYYYDPRLWLQRAPTFSPTDSPVDPADLNLLISAISQRQGTAFNTVTVLAPLQGQMADILPAAPGFFARARVSAASENSPERTGFEKHLWLSDGRMAWPGSAFYVASRMAQTLEGSFRWPTLRLPRGNPGIVPGVKIVPRLAATGYGNESDQSLRLNGVECRCLKVNTRLAAPSAKAPASYEQTVAIFPLNPLELALTSL